MVGQWALTFTIKKKVNSPFEPLFKLDMFYFKKI